MKDGGFESIREKKLEILPKTYIELTTIILVLIWVAGTSYALVIAFFVQPLEEDLERAEEQIHKLSVDVDEKKNTIS